MFKTNQPKENLTKQITLKYIDNQSHGYIQISKYDLDGLDIDIKDIGSKYSFYNENNACYYLEEDCDGLALQRLLEKQGYIVKYNTIQVQPEHFDNYSKFQRLSIN